MGARRGTLLERFERHYIPEPNSGCWLWTGSISKKHGYGQLSGKGDVPHRAHVLSYKLFRGPVPKGLDVMHSCDVRCCVNPEHLSLGTRLDNMRDALAKGRVARGAKLPRTRLTDAEIEIIRHDPRKQKVLAKIFGVNASYISMVKAGKRRVRT